jgi:hypothetical protein
MPDDRAHFGSQYLRARAINAEPWEPMQGMVKTICVECRFFFAASDEAKVRLCPDCAERRHSRHSKTC